MGLFSQAIYDTDGTTGIAHATLRRSPGDGRWRFLSDVSGFRRADDGCEVLNTTLPTIRIE